MNRGLTSTAVMARRHEPADSLDYFPTPPWATRALCEHVLPVFEPNLLALDALDPACGEGHMALALRDYFDICTATDIFGYGFGNVADFLHPGQSYAPRDWIITNPPFNLGVDFVKRALGIARRGVAMLVRTALQLRALIERIERLNEDKDTINDDLKDVYAEAKGTGFDTKAIKTLVRLRRMDQAERQEAESILDLYKAALGMA